MANIAWDLLPGGEIIRVNFLFMRLGKLRVNPFRVAPYAFSQALRQALDPVAAQAASHSCAGPEGRDD